MHPDWPNKLVYGHINKNILDVHCKTQRKFVRMLNKYLRSKAQRQLLTSKFTNEYEGKIFGVDLSKWLHKEEVEDDLNEDIIAPSGKTTSGNEVMEAKSEKGKVAKLFEDDDDFLSDIEEGEDDLSAKDIEDMPFRHQYVHWSNDG
ncbi:hypothetical protein R1flu_015657 [Riccia fluitans]|uniref:Transposase n=1 Tax=Riccia fluitans TaxID=41844 RepID=A0ABD1YJM0_9MARC